MAGGKSRKQLAPVREVWVGGKHEATRLEPRHGFKRGLKVCFGTGVEGGQQVS